MRLYRTKDNNIINLEQVSMIYVDKEWSRKDYKVVLPSGKTIYVPELTEEDIDRIMNYNDYLIKEK